MNNRAKETIQPVDALKLLAATLNNPSIKHERVNMVDVWAATAAVIAGNAPARVLAITSRGVVIKGLPEVMACVHAWKPVTFEVERDVRGEMAYRRGPVRAVSPEDIGKIEHSISILDSALKIAK